MGKFALLSLLQILFGAQLVPASDVSPPLAVSDFRKWKIEQCLGHLTSAPSPRFDWDKLPERFRLASSPTDKVVLYRGDARGLEKTGMRSYALLDEQVQKIEEARQVIASGDLKRINALLEGHTNNPRDSALLSTTFSPKHAQVYARSTRFYENGDSGSTIYKIEVEAFRAILDADNVGASGRLGEVFVLGEVRPEEIVAVKIKNDDQSSELYNERWQSIADFPERDDTDFNVKDASNWAVGRER